MVDLNAIADPQMRRATESQVANFGQTPSQLFRERHPRRLQMNDALTTAGYAPTSTSVESGLSMVRETNILYLLYILLSNTL